MWKLMICESFEVDNKNFKEAIILFYYHNIIIVLLIDILK